MRILNLPGYALPVINIDRRIVIVAVLRLLTAVLRAVDIRIFVGIITCTRHIKVIALIRAAFGTEFAIIFYLSAALVTKFHIITPL